MNPVDITPRLLRELIRYEPETGKMFWKERDPRFFADTGSAFLWNVDNAGSEIFEKTSADGYRKGSLPASMRHKNCDGGVESRHAVDGHKPRPSWTV